MDTRFLTFLVVTLGGVPIIPELHAAGGPGYALRFDGNDDRVQVGMGLFPNRTNSFTIELWVNPTGFRTLTAEVNTNISALGQRFAVFPEHGDSGYGAGHAGAGLSIGTNGISVYEHGLNHLPSVLVYPTVISEWTHVALVYVNRVPILYVNGAAVRTGLASPKAVHPSANLGGSSQGIGYGNFQGDLDEVRIWALPRTQAEIQYNMNRSLTGAEPNLVSYYRCDDGFGTNLMNAAPHVNGTLVNGTAWTTSGVLPFTPWVETLGTTGVTATATTLNGFANPEGTNTSVWFEWGTTPGFGNVTPTESVGSGTNGLFFSHALTGLEANMAYYFRAVASNSLGVVLGSGHSFATFYVGPPTVQTLLVSGLSVTTGSLNGVANPKNTNTSVWFEWGNTPNYGSVTPPQPLGSGDVSANFSQLLTGLIPGVSYHFRAVASNSLGVAFGGDRSFTTPLFVDINAGLPALPNSWAEWGDYNNDGRLDIAISGSPNDLDYESQWWRNIGIGFASALTNLPPAGLPRTSRLSLADYNNDERLDIFLPPHGFRNTGGAFEARFDILPVGIRWVLFGEWADYDNDGRLDLAGFWIDALVDNGIALFRNIAGGFSDGAFNHFLPLGLADIGLTDAMDWGDYDDDGRPDLAGFGRVYRNTPSGFTNIQAGPPRYGSMAWGDYNNDGRLDILVTGWTNITVTSAVSEVWRNTGSEFTNANVELPGVHRSSAAWGDYDNDGRLDILLAGTTNGAAAGAICQVWRNTGNGFINANAGLPGVHAGRVVWGDYDNDGRLDILLTGTNTANQPFTQVWRNYTPLSNTPPSAPTGLRVAAAGTNVTFSWNPSSDAQTPASGLTYNIRVGTSPGGSDVFSAMSAPNGFRRLAQPGNCRFFAIFSHAVVGMPYYWSVQAIDGAFAGSPFSTENSFKLLQLPPPPQPAPVLVSVTTTNLRTGDLNGDGVFNESELQALLSDYFAASPFLEMTNVAGLGGTNVTFALNNPLAGAFSVEVTTNLLDWFFRGPATPRYEFNDANAPAEPQRFYRLRWP